MNDKEQRGNGERRNRGIYLLPNLFTTATLFAGFYAIIAATQARYESAAIAIFVALIMDGLDGRVARLTGTQSDFGAEYDSLSDLIAFGLAPALLMFEWTLVDLGKVGWLVAFVYSCTTALRLARFNTQVGVKDPRYFQGLPSPSAAAAMASIVWLAEDFHIASDLLTYPAAVLTLTIGLLMVSNMRYHSFKEIDFKGRVPFLTIVAGMLVFVTIFLQPPVVLFSGFSLYVLSGLVLTLLQMRRARQERRFDKSD